MVLYEYPDKDMAYVESLYHFHLLFSSSYMRFSSAYFSTWSKQTGVLVKGDFPNYHTLGMLKVLFKLNNSL